MFCLLGVSFFSVGVAMNRSLKKYFASFYNRYNCVLWAACLLLTIPLLFRAIINGAQSVSPSFKSWWTDQDRFVVTNTSYLILSTYIPIVS